MALPKRIRHGSILPGFGLSMAITISWLTLIVLIPLAAAILKTLGMGWNEFVRVGFSSRAIDAYQLSFGTAAAAGAFNMLFGLLLAWVLVRYQFPGRRLVEALVDLPFALPTAVAGIALTTLYVPSGWVGRFAEQAGVQVAFTPLGITLALIFVGIPFVVRSVEPVLRDVAADQEEAALTLGATRFQTFWLVLLPTLAPALLSGFALAFARAVGEYGSVIFISGNMPGKTEIAPLLIVTQLEQYEYSAATANAVIMMVIAFGVLLTINSLQLMLARRGKRS
ncbi:sulfate ABC transporter permease subunit CysT [Sphingomonas jaspsi]|uniref:sulfate ABC transporter permease subunit CysT n=1 Tax=Sphingomonas jaspsi TaxID=392409 RepID=UPI000568340B|nr:sulfate ABC transporter permease subunit CysT [Sphingomonas jaspsi]